MIISPNVREQNPKVILILPPPLRGKAQEGHRKEQNSRRSDSIKIYGGVHSSWGLEHTNVYVYRLFGVIIRTTNGCDRSKFYK
jgi:hypothetical protein